VPDLSDKWIEIIRRLAVSINRDRADDLASVGALAVLEYLHKKDVPSGNIDKLITTIAWRNMKRWMDTDRVIKIPKGMLSNLRQDTKSKAPVGKEHQSEPEHTKAAARVVFETQSLQLFIDTKTEPECQHKNTSDHETIELVQSFLSQLTEQQQTLLCLRYDEKTSFINVSIIMKLSLAKIYEIHTEILAFLRYQLDQEEL